MAFEQVKLAYSYDALEPHIDAQTMELHYSKHHAGYTAKLNAALENHSEYQDKSIEELFSSLSSLPEDLKKAVRNNGGGYFNHNLFWEILSPEKTMPSDDFKAKLEESFGGFEDFKNQFEEAAKTRFGSGWAWLCLKDGKLEICSTANQDNPLMSDIGCKGTPILAIDVWEHAYYLHYQNRRPDYISAFWNVVNWEKVEENYNSAS